MLSFKKLTWRNCEPVPPCITQQKRVNNRLCQSLTMTELEQGFLGSLSPTGNLAHTAQKRSLLSLLFEFAFSGRMGPHEKQQCHQAGCKNTSLKWNLGALEWDELSDDHPCRVLKNM